MNSFSSPTQSHQQHSNELVCLGLVVFPQQGMQSQALHDLEAFSCVEVGTPQAHRIPAVAEIVLGNDELLINQLEALPSVLKVAVVFAQTLEETNE